STALVSIAPKPRRPGRPGAKAGPGPTGCWRRLAKTRGGAKADEGAWWIPEGRFRQADGNDSIPGGSSAINSGARSAVAAFRFGGAHPALSSDGSTPRIHCIRCDGSFANEDHFSRARSEEVERGRPQP